MRNQRNVHMKNWTAKLFTEPALARMGHLQRIEDLNLGLGWVYYALARVIRPKKVVVIGSYRGFVPLVLGKALSDNREHGKVIFIDPSFVDDFWKDAKSVRNYFAGFEVTNVQHYLMTTQEFAHSRAYRTLGRLGMVFVDGYHSEEQARFDYETFERMLRPNGIALFHDSVRCKVSRIYGQNRPYKRRVRVFIDKLKQDPCLQVFDLPFGEGLTLVRKVRRMIRAKVLSGDSVPKSGQARYAIRQPINRRPCAITSYFNRCATDGGRANYQVFRERLNVPLVAVEVAYGPDSSCKK
jgi:predicted O-methyltransferase YrrM